jgi:hypothetical protein
MRLVCAGRILRVNDLKSYPPKVDVCVEQRSLQSNLWRMSNLQEATLSSVAVEHVWLLHDTKKLWLPTT